MNQRDRKAVCKLLVARFNEKLEAVTPKDAADPALNYGRRVMDIKAGTMLDALWTGFVMGTDAGLDIAQDIAALAPAHKVQ